MQSRTTFLEQKGASIRADLSRGDFTNAPASWATYRRVDGERAILRHHLARVTRVLASAQASLASGAGLASAGEGAAKPDAESLSDVDSDNEFLEAVDSDTESESDD